MKFMQSRGKQDRKPVSPGVLRHFSRAMTVLLLGFFVLLAGGRLYQAFHSPTRSDAIGLFAVVGSGMILMAGYYAYIAWIAFRSLNDYGGNRKFLILSAVFTFVFLGVGSASGIFAFFMLQNPDFGPP